MRDRFRKETGLTPYETKVDADVYWGENSKQVILIEVSNFDISFYYQDKNPANLVVRNFLDIEKAFKWAKQEKSKFTWKEDKK